MIGTKVEVRPATGTMILADLVDFVEKAKALGVRQDAMIEARVTMRGKLRSVTAACVTDSDA